MEVFEIGSEVLIDVDVPGIVTGINIRGVEHRLQYEVTWWDERNRKSDWFDPFEIKAKGVKIRTLKFVPLAS